MTSLVDNICNGPHLRTDPELLLLLGPGGLALAQGQVGLRQLQVGLGQLHAALVQLGVAVTLQAAQLAQLPPQRVVGALAGLQALLQGPDLTLHRLVLGLRRGGWMDGWIEVESEEWRIREWCSLMLSPCF